MQHISAPTGLTVSYDQYGSGPPLVLVHGSFTDHNTNWEFMKPLFEERFTVYAIARRGRGDTDTTEGHRVEDEGMDVAALIDSIGQPVFLLGHSYGAQTALAAAANIPDRVRKLVLYEPPWPRIIQTDTLAQLEDFSKAGNWDGLAEAFFRDVLSLTDEDVQEFCAGECWPKILADAEASLSDIRALNRYHFQPDRFRGLRVPVLLQIGTESPRDLYITDALAAVLPDARIEELPGQAHEGMNTVPKLYAEAVFRFLLS